jgi:hypothetical protein
VPGLADFHGNFMLVCTLLPVRASGTDMDVEVPEAKWLLAALLRLAISQFFHWMHRVDALLITSIPQMNA